MRVSNVFVKGLIQLLVEMDGVGAKDNKILVLGATNRPEILDAALRRPGRFDRIVSIELPDLRGREEILRIHGQNRPWESTEEYDKIIKHTAAITPSMSGADLANLMNEAAILMIRNKSKYMGMSEFGSAAEKIMNGLPTAPVEDEKMRRRLVYLEACRAAVAMDLPDYARVLKVTTVARGGHYTRTQLVRSESRAFRSELMTKSEAIGEIAAKFSGRLAEEIFVGADRASLSTEADLQHATLLAKDLVMKYGSTFGYVRCTHMHFQSIAMDG